MDSRLNIPENKIPEFLSGLENIMIEYSDNYKIPALKEKDEEGYFTISFDIQLDKEQTSDFMRRFNAYMISTQREYNN
ncbi:hypothetical protein KY334_05520 [Candidatus Woesearchaeota archaeon]|nr:hypothetical protein [Candidatus Woesearchaeota archaeon]